MNQVVELLEQLAQKQAELAAMEPLPPATKRVLNDKLRLEWNYHSNRMEGSPITLEETRSIMLDHVTVEGSPIKYVLEMRGHDDVLRRIQRATNPSQLRITERFIKEIHAAILKEPNDPELAAQIGKWKSTPNYLYNNLNERVDFTPPEDVPKEMNELVNWLDNQFYKPIAEGKPPLVHPVQLAAELHLRFIMVHPFYDGNGRVCRILMNLVLIAAGYPPAIIRADDRDAYNQRLTYATAYQQDPVPFVAFVAERVNESLDLVLRAARGESIEDVQDWKRKLEVLRNMTADAARYRTKYSREIALNTILPLVQALAISFKELHTLFGSFFNEIRSGAILGSTNRYGNWGEDISPIESVSEWQTYDWGIHVDNEDVYPPYSTIELTIRLSVDPTNPDRKHIIRGCILFAINNYHLDVEMKGSISVLHSIAKQKLPYKRRFSYDEVNREDLAPAFTNHFGTLLTQLFEDYRTMPDTPIEPKASPVDEFDMPF